MTGATLYVGRIELAQMLAAAGLTAQEWADVAPPAVFMWPGTPKWKRASFRNIVRAAKAARCETIDTQE